MLAMPLVWKILRGHVWTMLGICTPNLKSIAVIVLDPLAFNNQKFGGHMTLATLPLWKFFQTVPGNMRVKCKVRSFNHVISI